MMALPAGAMSGIWSQEALPMAVELTVMRRDERVDRT